MPAGRAAGRAAARPGRGCQGRSWSRARAPARRWRRGERGGRGRVGRGAAGSRPGRSGAVPSPPCGRAALQPVPPPNPNHIGRRFPFPPWEAHAAPCIVFGTAARMRPRAGGESRTGGLRTPGEGSSHQGRAGSSSCLGSCHRPCHKDVGPQPVPVPPLTPPSAFSASQRAPGHRDAVQLPNPALILP